ncbi:hypothetical protein BYT27DRAFT_7222383 [Phlegmacium glaucopus]|nr:hypothetical protein BYT27DRAFT_7222383 [Phlegmacium glaucopus]
MIVSDTTGNVKKCHILICDKWPWILNCPDPCHQLNLMMKDIMAMVIISGLTTYFSHSNYGQHQLKAEMDKEKDKQGIQAGGATRFSTFSTHAKSISRCFGAIERCLSSGSIKFDTKATAPLQKYIQPGPDSYKFRTELHHINMLLTPIDRGLQTLEGQNTACSDVMAVFIGIAIGFTNVFKDSSDVINTYRTKTYGDFTPDMFLLAYLLDPSKR